MTVRALKIFHKDGDLRGDMTTHGEEFEVDRSAPLSCVRTA